MIRRRRTTFCALLHGLPFALPMEECRAKALLFQGTPAWRSPYEGVFRARRVLRTGGAWGRTVAIWQRGKRSRRTPDHCRPERAAALAAVMTALRQHGVARGFSGGAGRRTRSGSWRKFIESNHVLLCAFEAPLGRRLDCALRASVAARAQRRSPQMAAAVCATTKRTSAFPGKAGEAAERRRKGEEKRKKFSETVANVQKYGIL